MSAAIDAKVKEYSEVQKEISILIGQKQQLMNQINENSLVHDEFKFLSEDDQVFQLVGPVLLPIALPEAKGLVSKRLTMLDGEISKVEANIEVQQNKAKAIGDEVANLQRELQGSAAEAARQAAGLE